MNGDKQRGLIVAIAINQLELFVRLLMGENQSEDHMFTVIKTVFATFSTLVLTAFLSSQTYAATVEVSTDNLIFPDVCPEYSVTKSVGLTNTSSDPVTLDIWIQDNTWDQFSIISPDPLPSSLAGSGDRGAAAII